MEQYVQQLQQLAQQNVQQGGSPYSALVVYNDEVVAQAVNQFHETNDPTHHAELLAIQKAVQILTPEQLKEAVIYASGEPCPMCYGAAQFIQMKEMYYVVARDEVAAMGKASLLPTITKEHIPNTDVKKVFEKWAQS